MLFGKNVILVFDNIKNYLKSIQRWFFDLNAKTEKKQVTFNGKPQKYWWSTNVYKSYQLRNGLSNTKLRRSNSFKKRDTQRYRYRKSVDEWVKNFQQCLKTCGRRLCHNLKLVRC